MKLKVYVSILLLVGLGFISKAWAEVEVPERIKNVAPVYMENKAKIITAVQFEEGAQIVYEISTERKEVVKFYKDTMQKKGWKVVMEMNMENNSILNLAKDNLNLMVNTGASPEGKTTVQLVLQDK